MELLQDKTPPTLPVNPTDRNIRDLSMFIAGHLYTKGNETYYESRLPYSAVPEDIASLLGGLAKREANWVIEWFANRGATIDAEHNAPAAAIECIRAAWVAKATRNVLSGLEFSRHLSPGEALHHAKEAVRILESIGVVDTPPLAAATIPVEQKHE